MVHPANHSQSHAMPWVKGEEQPPISKHTITFDKEYIMLEDGSRWTVIAADKALLANWKPKEQVVIDFKDNSFCLINLTSKIYVCAQLAFAPAINKRHPRIEIIDHANGQITLSDQSCFSIADLNNLKDWDTMHSIIVGMQQGPDKKVLLINAFLEKHVIATLLPSKQDKESCSIS